MDDMSVAELLFWSTGSIGVATMVVWLLRVLVSRLAGRRTSHAVFSGATSFDGADRRTDLDLPDDGWTAPIFGDAWLADDYMRGGQDVLNGAPDLLLAATDWDWLPAGSASVRSSSDGLAGPMGSGVDPSDPMYAYMDMHYGGGYGSDSGFS